MARKHTAEFKQKVLAEHAAGAQVLELSKKYGLGNSMLYQWRKQQQDGKLVENKPTLSRFTPQQMATAVAELQAGGRATEIAKRFGVSDASIYAWRKKLHQSPKPGKSNGHGPAIAVPKGTFTDNQFADLRGAMTRATALLRQAKSYIAEHPGQEDKAHVLMKLALMELQGE